MVAVDSARQARRAGPPSFAAAANPIDLTPQCPPASFPAAIRAVFEDPVYYPGPRRLSPGIDALVVKASGVWT